MVKRGTLTASWGPYGGFYVARGKRGGSIRGGRICLGCLALTYLRGIEIEDLMRAYVEKAEAAG